MFTSRNIPAKGRSLRSRAFTLLEVALALSILMLLVGVIYAMVDASLRGTAELQEKESRNQELGGFLSLCRKTFHTMPATVQFTARVEPQGENYVTELVFRNAPGILWWGDAKNSFESTILGDRAQVGGLRGLGILQDTEDEITSYLNGGSASRPWLMLLSDLRNVEWRFFDSRNSVWVKEWKDLTYRPAYAELTLATETGVAKYIFWLPPVVKSQQ